MYNSKCDSWQTQLNQVKTTYTNKLGLKIAGLGNTKLFYQINQNS